jgi:hypothetical protein
VNLKKRKVLGADVVAGLKALIIIAGVGRCNHLERRLPAHTQSGQ